MTILGVLGEAAKLSDAERRRRHPWRARGGRRPAGLRRGHPRGHGPGDRLRPRGGGAGRALGHARATGPRPPERRRRPRPLPRGRRRGRPAGRRPGPPGEQRRHDVGRAAGDHRRTGAQRAGSSSSRTSRARPRSAACWPPRPDLRILGGLGAIMLLEELRRGAVGTMTGFGFPELPGRDRRALPGRRRGRGARGLPPDHAAHPVREPAGHQPRRSASTSTSGAAPSRRPGSAPRARASTRARSPTSSSILRASAWPIGCAPA